MLHFLSVFFVGWLSLASVCLADPGASTGLTVDPRIQKNVNFWVSIYSKYTSHEGLVHDAKYIDHVYQVMDLRHTPISAHEAKKHWRRVLLSVHKKQGDLASLTPEERKVYDLFSDVNEPDKFLNAAHRKRLRFQLGQKDIYLEGLKMSGRYLPEMEKVFLREGLPVELTRLPFVESSFNVRARSKVGASGIWQFMRSTARLFIQINEAVDERNDPIRATEAAAKLLKGNYESLGRWPLAVTAYNHGRKGMMRAVRMVGSDEIGELVSNYQGRSFGFASSNFYSELMAAIECERNASQYFGNVKRDRPLEYYEIPLPDYIPVRALVKVLKLSPKRIRELNPALTDEVYSGRALIPAGYRLRLPIRPGQDRDSSAKIFLAGYSEIPKSLKLQAQRSARYAKRGRNLSEE